MLAFFYYTAMALVKSVRESEIVLTAGMREKRLVIPFHSEINRA